MILGQDVANLGDIGRGRYPAETPALFDKSQLLGSRDIPVPGLCAWGSLGSGDELSLGCTGPAGTGARVRPRRRHRVVLSRINAGKH